MVEIFDLLQRSVTSPNPCLRRLGHLHSYIYTYTHPYIYFFVIQPSVFFFLSGTPGWKPDDCKGVKPTPTPKNHKVGPYYISFYYVYMYLCTYVFTCMCMYVCMYVTSTISICAEHIMKLGLGLWLVGICDCYFELVSYNIYIYIHTYMMRTASGPDLLGSVCQLDDFDDLSLGRRGFHPQDLPAPRTHGTGEHIHTFMHTYINISNVTYTQLCIHTYKHTYTRVTYTYIHTFHTSFFYIHYVYIHYVYIHTYIHTYTHIHTHRV